MKKSTLIKELDKVLKFAIEHTDGLGRVVIEEEIDCKDSGWMILSGVIRLLHAGEYPVDYSLQDVLGKWTYSSSNVDDKRSAWTTFALLYSMYLSGGKDGFFYSSLDEKERRCLDDFFMKIDMKFLREASRNYQVAAGIINQLRLQFGYITEPDCPPEDSIKVMLDGYLGDGFFNDDDIRGSSLDRRIDAYSAEIIGLLLHYDEINDWKSVWHEKIEMIVKEFCEENRYLVDARGEYAKWGRSLRGEAEAKKLFIWEYAEGRGLVANAGDGLAAAQMQYDFFIENGISDAGQVYKDKAENKGLWDEYTTHVQAQGYGAYGLAMALHFVTDKDGINELPAQKSDYVRHLSGPEIITVNHAKSGLHCIVPLTNRLTKLMYLWHNRITRENDVSVDMSAKFMPIPYFGKLLPAPYADYHIPFLPLLCKGEEVLVPRNLEPLDIEVLEKDGRLVSRQRFNYCKPAEFETVSPVGFVAELSIGIDGLSYNFDFSQSLPDGYIIKTYLYIGGAAVKSEGKCASVNGAGFSLDFEVDAPEVNWRQEVQGPSIYAAQSPAIVAEISSLADNSFSYSLGWK